MNAKDPKPSQELHSREVLAPVFAELNQYEATTHFVGSEYNLYSDGRLSTVKPTASRITSRSTAVTDA